MIVPFARFQQGCSQSRQSSSFCLLGVYPPVHKVHQFSAVVGAKAVRNNFGIAMLSCQALPGCFGGGVGTLTAIRTGSKTPNWAGRAGCYVPIELVLLCWGGDGATRARDGGVAAEVHTDGIQTDEGAWEIRDVVVNDINSWKHNAGRGSLHMHSAEYGLSLDSRRLRNLWVEIFHCEDAILVKLDIPSLRTPISCLL